MHKAMKERCIYHGETLLEKNMTTRQLAEYAGVSKSTVYKDVGERLEHIDKDLYVKVKSHLANNKAAMHSRGGQSLRRKWLTRKEGVQ